MRWLPALLILCSCGERPPVELPPQPTEQPTAPQLTSSSCGGEPLTVKFYDVGQGLGVLVTLPDGRQILVDTGVAPKWPACSVCKTWSARFLEALEDDVTNDRIDAVWITHQHADHNGNADTVLRDYDVGLFVDNGTVGHTNGQKNRVEKIRRIARERGVTHRVVDPEHDASLWPESGDVRITPVVPKAWPVRCDRKKGVNNCSIGLRVDYCHASVLLTGDAEREEEAVLPVAPATLLQVAHHGSGTSSSLNFLAQVQPAYAVISSGKRDEGTNARYRHPLKETVARLNAVLPEPHDKQLWVSDGDWQQIATSDNLYATARDGHIEFETNGDGAFEVSVSSP